MAIFNLLLLEGDEKNDKLGGMLMEFYECTCYGFVLKIHPECELCCGEKNE